MKPSEKNPNPKPNPIEVAPAKDGNLVVDATRGLYRFATGNEKEMAHLYGRNLYISHFSRCPAAKEFRKWNDD